MTRMHEDELELDESLVRALLVEQFPQWECRVPDPGGEVATLPMRWSAAVTRLLLP
jgi:hypothetical protein